MASMDEPQEELGMSVRAQKAGDVFLVEKKMEKRYDDEEALGTPVRIMQWMNDALNGEPGFTPLQRAGWQEIQKFLKDGVNMCRLLNKLLKHAGMPPVPYQTKASRLFVAMNNIEKYNGAAIQYGVPRTSLFQTNDLVEGRKAGMLNVIFQLNQLGTIANQRGFTPAYCPPAPPKPDWS